MAATPDSTHKRLYLSGIPSEYNNVQILSDYFKKFGTISKLKVAYHGNSAAALVTFASHKEANDAMDSQEPVLGNRDIQKRWGIRTPNPSSAPQQSPSTPPVSPTSSASASASASPSTPSKSPEITYQCDKCTKILATKQSLQNHMRQLHAKFHCPVCQRDFESAREFRKHYNAEHSDSKDFTRCNTSDSKDFARVNGNINFQLVNLTETVTSLRRENSSLKKKVKKHKKDKSKVAKQLQKQLVKFLEEKNAHHSQLDAMRQQNKDLTNKVATFTTLQESYSQLQQEKMQISQNLMNEQMKTEMLRNTLQTIMCRQR